jgi:bla regulator protein BlaR1
MVIRAQSSNADLPSFEVVSIKPNPNRNPYATAMAGGDLSHEMMRLTTVKFLITYAYNVRSFQVSGGPDWIGSDRFDIDAKPDDATLAKLEAMTRDETLAYRRLLYQSLLADRFKLAVHHATVEGAMYSLVVAKPGKLPVAKGDCPAPGAPHDPGVMPCGATVLWPGHVEQKSVPINTLVFSLTTLSGKLVLDNTHLTGTYDITLEWTPDSTRLGPPDPNSPFPAPDPNGPSLEEVLEEKLGLKLVPTTGPVDNIVIDHIEEPSPN